MMHLRHPARVQSSVWPLHDGQTFFNTRAKESRWHDSERSRMRQGSADSAHNVGRQRLRLGL